MAKQVTQNGAAVARVRSTIVLKKDTQKLESEFHTACHAAGVYAFMTAEAAKGFPQYHISGPAWAVAAVTKKFAK